MDGALYTIERCTIRTLNIVWHSGIVTRVSAIAINRVGAQTILKIIFTPVVVASYTVVTFTMGYMRSKWSSESTSHTKKRQVRARAKVLPAISLLTKNAQKTLFPKPV